MTARTTHWGWVRWGWCRWRRWWGRQLPLGAISLDLFAVLLGGAAYLLPIYTRDLIPLGGIGLSPGQALGWVRAAPAAGALCMVLLLTHLPPMRRAGRHMLLAVAGFGLATIVFGLSRNLWLSMAMLFLTGLFENVSVVVRQTLVQLATPNEMRSRVSAVNAIFIGSSNELGGFESGLVARLFNPVFSVVSGGLGTLAFVAIWTGAFPALRRVRALDDTASLHTAPTGRRNDPRASSSAKTTCMPCRGRGFRGVVSSSIPVPAARACSPPRSRHGPPGS